MDQKQTDCLNLRVVGSEKRCTVCKRVVPIEAFHLDNGKRTAACGKCRTAHQLAYQKRNQSKYNAAARARYAKDPIKDFALHLKKRHGITLERFYEMSGQQQNKCAICGWQWDGSKNRLHVDHDHTNGNIRGLLCQVCNIALGYFKDSPLLLKRAAEYIEKHQ